MRLAVDLKNSGGRMVFLISVRANTPSTSPTLRPRRSIARLLGAEPFHCTTLCQCVSHKNG